MKKLILFLMIMLAVGVQAQRTMDAGSFYDEYTGVTADTASQYTTWTKYILVNKGDAFYYDMQAKITEVTATTATDVIIQGRKFSTDTYTAIDTVRYYGTGSDTTITFTQNSSKQFYRDMEYVIKPSNGKVRVSFLKTAIKK